MFDIIVIPLGILALLFMASIPIYREINENIEEVEEDKKIPVETKKYEENVEDYFENEIFNDLNITETIENNQPNEVIQPEVPTEPKRLYYNNRNGGSFRINRI